MTSIENLFHKTIDEAASRQAQSTIAKQTDADLDILHTQARAYASPLRKMFGLIAAQPKSEQAEFSTLVVLEHRDCVKGIPHTRFYCTVEHYKRNDGSFKPSHMGTNYFDNILVSPDGDAKLIVHVEKTTDGIKEDSEVVVGGSIEVIAGLFLKDLIATKALCIDDQVQKKINELRLTSTRSHEPVTASGTTPTHTPDGT